MKTKQKHVSCISDIYNKIQNGSRDQVHWLLDVG